MDAHVLFLANLRNNDANLLYTGTVFFEGVNVSEGRGTDNPFAQAGAIGLAGLAAVVPGDDVVQVPDR